MALTNILEKIEKELKEKLEKLEQEFADKRSQQAKEAEAEQKRIDEEMNGKVDENSKKIIEKAENLAEREAQIQLLQAKRTLIEETLVKGVEALRDSDKYEEVLTTMLKNSGLEGDVVVVPAKGMEDVTKKAIKSSGQKYFLSDKSKNIKGGFVLKTDTVEVDNSFENIVMGQLGQDLEIKLNKLLFT